MPVPLPNARVPFAVLHEDARILVVDKPAGVVTEPGRGHSSDALLNGLVHRHGPELTALGDRRDYGLLHRLDRDTTGVLLVARDAPAYDMLRRQFEERTVGKKYLALVQGKLPRPEGTVALPLMEVRRGDMKVSVVDRSARATPATTRYAVLGRGSGATLASVELVTGRLHQIRAHMALLGCPVLNDPVYRAELPPNTSPPPRGRPVPPLALHAWELRFQHPDGESMIVRAPVPGSFTSLLASLQIPLPVAPAE